MKTPTLFLGLLIIASMSAFAGGSAAEFPSALIEFVDKGPNCWTATGTGEVTLFVSNSTESSGVKVMTLLANKAVLKFPLGNQLYVARDQKAYEQRLKDSVGKKESIQIWGAITTIGGGGAYQLLQRETSRSCDQRGKTLPLILDD